MPPLLKSPLVRSIVIVATLVGLYAVVGFQLAPGWLREQARQYVREHYQRDLKIGEIRLQPFTLQAEIRDLVLPDADGQPMLGLARLFVDFEFASLWHRAFTFQQVTIDAPLVRAVHRPDGTFNLSDLSGAQQPTGPERPLPPVWIRRLELTQGQVGYLDQAGDKPLAQRFQGVSFQLSDFRTTPEGGSFQLNAQSANGATLASTGHVALTPVIASRGDFKVGDWPVPGLVDLLGDAVPFGAPTGTVSLGGTYRVALGRPLQLEVQVPSVTLRDVALAARGVSEPWVRLPSAVVSGVQLALPARAVNITKLSFDAPQATLWLNPDRSVNVQAMFAPRPVAASADGPAPAPAAAPAANAATAAAVASRWTVLLGSLDVGNAVIDFEDRSIAVGTRFRIAPLNLRLANASLDLSRPLPLTIDAVIDDRARFEAQGTVTPAPLAASVDLKLAKVRLGALQPYLLPFAALTVNGGDLDVAGRLELAPPSGPSPAMSFAGDLTIDGFASVDNALKQDLLKFRKLELARLRYASNPDALSIERINVSEPYARVIIGQDQVVNLAAVLKAREPAQAASAASSALSTAASTAVAVPRDAPAQAMTIRIGEMGIDRMRMNFTDNFIEPNFAADVRQLSGTITGLSNARDARAKVKLKGNLGEFSPVAIDGELQAFAFDRYTDLGLRFENIPLPIFNPYSGSLAGYNIDKGQLTTVLRYRITDRRLDAQHRIRIDQLEWGEASRVKGEATLPVKFATALLKDRNGVIDLDLPVGGTLDDPSFRIGPIVWQIIGNLITKAVTAPFALLGSVSKGAEEAQFIEFAAGDASLPAAAAGKLAALGKSLAEKPSLKVDVPIGTLAPLDKPALDARAYDAALAAKVAARLGLQPGAAVPAFESLEPARRIEVLTTLIASRTGAAPTLSDRSDKMPPVPLAASLPEATRSAAAQAAQGESETLTALELAARASFSVPDTDLAELGKERALAVERALLAGTGLSAGRVFKVGAGKVTAQEGRVRFELGLQ